MRVRWRAIQAGVGVGQRKIALARTFAHDQLQGAGRPHLAGLARLVGDQHDLEPPPLGRLGDVSEPRRLLGVSDQRHHAVRLVEQHAHGVGIELARDQHGGVLAGQLVGGRQRAGERQRAVGDGDGLGAGHARGGDQARDHAFQGRSRDQADLLAAGRARPHARAEQSGAARAGPEQPLALGLDDVDQDAGELSRELEQVGGVELERVGDRACRHRRRPFGAGDRVLRADHVALAHPELDLAAARRRPGGPDHEAAGDQPDAVAGIAGGTQLVAGGELARAHARGHDLELVGGESVEQATSAERRFPGHLATCRRKSFSGGSLSGTRRARQGKKSSQRRKVACIDSRRQWTPARPGAYLEACR